MSEEQKKQDEGTTPEETPKPEGGLPGPLPGLGGAPSKAPLPGLGGQPKGPLPGLGGAPSKAALPGLGGGGGLPGLGQKPAAPAAAAPAAPVPSFLKKDEPEPEPEPAKPAGPSKEEIERDPFGHAPVASETAIRPSFAPGQGLIGEAEDGTSYSGADAGRSKLPLIIGGVAIGAIAIIIGFMLGSGKSNRVERNIAIRDAYIIQWELEQVETLFNNVQAKVNTAVGKAAKLEFEPSHIAYLKTNVKGNPVKPTLFTERNYKRFKPPAPQWMMEYAQKWDKLASLAQTHRIKTEADQANLEKSRAEIEKFLKSGYGVAFGRQNDNLEANIVALLPGEKEGEVMAQAAPGTSAYPRKIYNPESGDSKLSEEPDEYVVLLSKISVDGILSKSVKTHFAEYSHRLREISDLMRGMNELQANLKGQIETICSQEAVMLGGIDPEEELQKYIKSAKAAAAAAADPAAE